jgi:hypothetical protein
LPGLGGFRAALDLRARAPQVTDLPHIAPEWREQWRKDCLKWRGRVLTGSLGHWCDEWDGLPIDQTTPEFPCKCLGSVRKLESFAKGVRK